MPEREERYASCALNLISTLLLVLTILLPYGHKGSNTGKRARGKDFYWSPTRLTEKEPRWRPEIFPWGVWDFSVLPSYRCLILFLTNFLILYVFRCLILFLTKHLWSSLFCLHSIKRFPAKLFSVGEVNCRFIDIHPCIGSILIVFHNKIQCI